MVDLVGGNLPCYNFVGCWVCVVISEFGATLEFMVAFRVWCFGLQQVVFVAGVWVVCRLVCFVGCV